MNKYFSKACKKLPEIIHCINYHTNKRGEKNPILKHNGRLLAQKHDGRCVDNCEEHHCSSLLSNSRFYLTMFFSISPSRMMKAREQNYTQYYTLYAVALTCLHQTSSEEDLELLCIFFVLCFFKKTPNIFLITYKRCVYHHTFSYNQSKNSS